MDRVVPLYKRIGETPLETLGRLREASRELEGVPLSYAGRLDPMAQGVLLALVGGANKDRDRYLGYDKRYYFDVVFGCESDTYDPLGMVRMRGPVPFVSIDDLNALAVEFEGRIEQIYPPYSSKTVEGKPLFMWAREGRSVPRITRPVVIYSITPLSVTEVSPEFLGEVVTEKISMVGGDFRQVEALESWRELVRNVPPGRSFPVTRFEVHASSGTYVRALAHAMGNTLGVGALALHIVRTVVGPFSLEDTRL